MALHLSSRMAPEPGLIRGEEARDLGQFVRGNRVMRVQRPVAGALGFETAGEGIGPKAEPAGRAGRRPGPVMPSDETSFQRRAAEKAWVANRTVALAGRLLVIGLGLVAAGCARPPVPPATSPTVVTVSHPVERTVTDHADFTGRTAAVESVEVRARGFGYLEKINFKEGALVEKGDVLFEIDPRTYQTALAQAEGNLASMQARLRRLDADLTRVREASSRGAGSQQDFDKVMGDRGEAEASLGALRAAVEQARLDLHFTKVIAPVSGRVSRALVTVGNLISSGQTGGTVLTTIVSVNPVYAYFDVDELTLLKARAARASAQSGNGPAATTSERPVFMALATEDGFPRRGTLDFVDNQLNPKTGTLRVRAVFANPDGSLTPGLFVRVRIPVGDPHPALLVTDRAVETNQGQKLVYVVDEKNEVVSRPVRLGASHDGLRAVEAGLKPGERVIVNGLQRVRPGVVVDPKPVGMPVPPRAAERGGPTSGGAAPGSK
ncbi:MAG: family efflux transporter, subunit [Gemmataceae bacterium]|nr:family efflux transporter, subunit [Gemmataceae bacterium]